MENPNEIKKSIKNYINGKYPKLKFFIKKGYQSLYVIVESEDFIIKLNDEIRKFGDYKLISQDADYLTCGTSIIVLTNKNRFNKDR